MIRRSSNLWIKQESFDSDMNEFWLGRLSDMIVRRIPKTRSLGKFCSLPTRFDYSSTAGILVDHSFVSTNTMNARTPWSSCQTLREVESYESFIDSSFAIKRDDRNSDSNSSFLPTISLGRLSLLILILATLADQAIVQVYYRSSTSSNHSPRFSLGSAAISTVTEKLSPILPFAGGMDIRRDDYWSTGSWVDSFRSISTNVQDAYSRKQQEQTTPTHKPKKQPQAKKKTRRAVTLSAPKPFYPVDTIAELTLGDIGELFRWASGQHNSRNNNARVSKTIQSMERTIQNAGVGLSSTQDSLKFVAAMRIFAEWRIVRQVPDGYKGFAVGMSLGHKDVVQNLVKMEEAIHQWLDDHPDAVRPPTLRELLVWEIDIGVNPSSNLPRLKEKSAGIGLLWVRRQLAYQTKIFDNVVHSDRFPSMKEAVSDAYKVTYDRYHGWAVQKIFNYSFQAAPDATEILRHMNPHKLREVMANAPNESSDEPSQNENQQRNPIQTFFHNLGEEWDKLRGAKSTQASQSTNHSSDDYVTRSMVQDAHVQIAKYLEAAQPVLEDLSILFDELNMDDPSRV